MEASSRLDYYGYEAWIEVDGQELPCYSTNIDYTKNIVTCWIASEIGKTFSIGWKPNNAMVSRRVRAYLDGMHVHTSCHEKKPKRYHRFIRGRSTSQTTEDPFIFSALELTDDEKYPEVITTDVGQIRIVIDSITGLVWRKAIKESRMHQVPRVEKVYEQCKNKMIHRIGFGDEQRSSEGGRWLVRYHTEACLVTFIFQYRPLDALRANHIAPHISDSDLVTPSEDNQPSSSTSSRPSKEKRTATDLKEGMQESIKNFEDRENALHAELSRLRDEKEQFLLAELEKLRRDKSSTNDSVPRK